MPTASHTWVFLSDAEGLVDEGLTANLTAAWSNTDGNLLGDLEWTSTGAFTTAGEAARKTTTTDTWTSLFGVPAGATVTNVQVTGWDELRWGNGTVTTRRVRFRIVGSGGSTVHSAGELFDTGAVSAPADGGVVHAMGAGTQQPVDSGSQPASTSVRLEIAFDIVGTGSPTVDYEQDNIAITATYVIAAGGPATTSRPMLFKLDGMQQPWQMTLGYPPPNMGRVANIFQQALTATATTTASFQNVVNKTMSAAATTTANIAKLVNKGMSATATSTASIVKLVNKALTATSTSTASMVTGAAHQVFMTATVTTTASIGKVVNKALSATSTTTASIAKLVNKALSATSTTTASVSKIVNKAFSATSTTTAAMTRVANKGLTATSTTTATITKLVNKKLTATATTIASLAASFVAGGGPIIHALTLTATVRTSALIKMLVPYGSVGAAKAKLTLFISKFGFYRD